MDSTVFLVMQWDAVVDGIHEIMGQIIARNLKYPISWLITSNLYKNKESFTMNYDNRNNDGITGRSDPLSQLRTLTTYKNISVIGLQIQPESILFIDPTGELNKRQYVSLESSSDAEGISIRGNRYIYEVRIYPAKSVAEEDMKSIWQEITATYNTS